MASRSTIRTQVLNLVGNNAAIEAADVNVMLQADNLEILDAHPWSFRNAWTNIGVVAAQTITIGVTSGNSAITSADLTAAMNGYLIRIAGESTWYKLGTIVAGVSAVLTDSQGNALNYTGTTDTDASATVFKYIYRVSTDAERILRAAHNVPLGEIDPDVFDDLDPERTATADPPYAWCHAGRDASGYLQIAFFPVPSAAIAIRVEFLRTAEMDDDADVTLYPSVLLKWKTAESAASFLLARTGDAAWASLADRYNKRYNEAFDKATAEDLLRQSPPTAIKDAGNLALTSDEFLIDHDLWRP